MNLSNNVIVKMNLAVQDLSRYVDGYADSTISYMGENGGARLVHFGNVYRGCSLHALLLKKDSHLARVYAFRHCYLNTAAFHFHPEQRPGYASEVFWALLSGHQEILHWITQYFANELVLVSKGISKCFIPGTYQHLYMVLHYALLKDWDRVTQEAKSAIEHGKFEYASMGIDYEFYLALASQDQDRMESALKELCKNKHLKKRNGELTFSAIKDVIYGWGFIYTKLAQLNGFEIDPECDYVPMELVRLGSLPAEAYTHDFKCMDDFDIWKPVNRDAAIYIANVDQLAPAKPGEPPLIIHQQAERIRLYTRTENNSDEAKHARKLQEAQYALTKSMLSSRGWEWVPFPEIKDAPGFDLLMRSEDDEGETMALIIGLNEIDDGGVQLYLNKKKAMQFSPEWYQPILAVLPDDCEAKKLLTSKALITTAVAGLDKTDQEFKLIKVKNELNL